MNFSNNEWKRLASSDNESDWSTALDLASEFKEKLQMELLYWLGSNIGFHWRFKIYDLLDDDNKKLALQSFPIITAYLLLTESRPLINSRKQKTTQYNR